MVVVSWLENSPATSITTEVAVKEEAETREKFSVEVASETTVKLPEALLNSTLAKEEFPGLMEASSSESKVTVPELELMVPELSQEPAAASREESEAVKEAELLISKSPSMLRSGLLAAAVTDTVLVESPM